MKQLEHQSKPNCMLLVVIVFHKAVSERCNSLNQDFIKCRYNKMLNQVSLSVLVGAPLHCSRNIAIKSRGSKTFI